MCGLFGMYSNAPLALAAVPTLLRVANSQVHRGHHAFGLAWVNEDRQILSFKRPGAVTDHPDDVARGEGALGLIGHTRWATHGSYEDNANNHPHPFSYKGRTCYLAHNGVVCNYAQIAAERGLTMRTECDSEVLARHIEQGSGHILDRVVAAIADVSSYAPCCVTIVTHKGVVLARRGNPLYWSETGNVAWFASTHAALPGRVYEVPNDRAFFIPCGPGSVREAKLRKREATTMRFVGSDLFAE
jgi:glucosamine 6-phosphate synthetase-like amidotransferase/phosphosugar isomerase protein